MLCSIEEADGRMLFRANNAANQSSKHFIKTVDSDVVVIPVTVFDRLEGVDELWIEFGIGKTLQCIPVHEIAKGVGMLPSPIYVVVVIQHLQ